MTSPERAPIKRSPGGTPYANSRIRAARGRLFTAEDVEAYLAETDLGSFTRRLGESTYGPSLEKAVLTNKGIDAINVALQTELSETYHWVYELCERKYRKLLAALAAKWDIQDLKTIIRAKAAGVPLSEKGISFVGVGVQISPEDIKALARQKTLEDVVSLALTWKLPYGKAFAEGLEAYYLRESIADFELKLDHEYVKWARRQFWGLGEGVRFAKEVFGQEIDKLNIATIIRMIDTVDEIEEPLSYFLDGGRFIDKKRFVKLIQIEDVFDLVEAIKIPEYEEAIKTGYDNYLLTGHLSEFERALEVRLTRKTITEGYHDILGFGVALSYLTAKENETTNLNIIAHGILRAVSPEIIRKDLILV